MHATMLNTTSLLIDSLVNRLKRGDFLRCGCSITIDGCPLSSGCPLSLSCPLSRGCPLSFGFSMPVSLTLFLLFLTMSFTSTEEPVAMVVSDVDPTSLGVAAVDVGR